MFKLYEFKLLCEGCHKEVNQMGVAGEETEWPHLKRSVKQFKHDCGAAIKITMRLDISSNVSDDALAKVR